MKKDAPKLGRRSLLSLNWKHAEATPAATPSFSLDSFYAARGKSNAAGATTPHVPLRAPFAATETTHVGTPELAEKLADHSQFAPVVGFEGVVRLEQNRCLAWQRSFCTVCSERCPIPGAIVVELGRPRVVAEECTGCGTCIAVCPAPINAFEIVRPPAASQEAPAT